MESESQWPEPEPPPLPLSDLVVEETQARDPGDEEHGGERDNDADRGPAEAVVVAEAVAEELPNGLHRAIHQRDAGVHVPHLGVDDAVQPPGDGVNVPACVCV